VRMQCLSCSCNACRLRMRHAACDLQLAL
jgi:hypothetical protein